MRTDFDIARSYVSEAAVFNPEFNNFALITANQAWSLLLTAGRDEGALGDNPELGNFFNNILAAVVLGVAIAAFTFRYI